jgi:hypothetical protein
VELAEENERSPVKIQIAVTCLAADGRAVSIGQRVHRGFPREGTFVPKEKEQRVPNVARRAMEEIKWFLRKFVKLPVGESTRAHVEASMRRSERRAAEVDRLMNEEWEIRKKSDIGDTSHLIRPDVP